MIASAIPVVLDDGVAERIAAENMQREVDLMLDWIRTHVPDLQGIRLTPGLVRPLSPNIIFAVAHRHVDPNEPPEDSSKPPRDLVEWDWACRKVENLPLMLARNLILSCAFYPLTTA